MTRLLPPKVTVFLFALVGLGFMALAYHAPALRLKYSARHYAPAYVASLDAIDFPRDRETLVAPGEFPMRSGKVMILRRSLTSQVSGWTRAPRIDEAWVRLSPACRAEGPREVRTLVSVFVLGGKVVISVYDLPSERLLAHYEANDYPEFGFAGRRMDIVEFVHQMPFGSPAALEPEPKPEPAKKTPPKLPQQSPTLPERRSNSRPGNGE